MKILEIIQKYGDEAIERPAITGKSAFEYRGYKVLFKQLSDGAYQIRYEPLLPTKELERDSCSCTSLEAGEKIAKRAIEIAHEMQVAASGQAAQSGEVGTPWNSSMSGKMHT